MKPTPDSPNEHKRRYILAKYVWKGFVEGSIDREADWAGGNLEDGDSGRDALGGGGAGGGGGEWRRGVREGGDGGGGEGRGGGAERWSLRLSECAATGDLAGAVQALAHGEFRAGGEGGRGVITMFNGGVSTCLV